MLKIKFIFAVLFLGSIPLVAADASNPFEIFLSDFQTLKANFTQILINEKGEQLEKATGVLYLQKPDKFHWSYEIPYVQQIIYNAGDLWVYDEELEQVTITNPENSLKQTPAGIILGETKLEKYFLQNNIGNIEGFEWIELIPLDPEAHYKNIRIGFANNTPKMMIINDHLGQTTRIDFSDMQKNEKLKASLFVFKVSKDLDIIDGRMLN